MLFLNITDRLSQKKNTRLTPVVRCEHPARKRIAPSQHQDEKWTT
jgi:hypothetical protein